MRRFGRHVKTRNRVIVDVRGSGAISNAHIDAQSSSVPAFSRYVGTLAEHVPHVDRASGTGAIYPVREIEGSSATPFDRVVAGIPTLRISRMSETTATVANEMAVQRFVVVLRTGSLSQRVIVIG
jgi:hypothetical protein